MKDFNLKKIKSKSLKNRELNLLEQLLKDSTNYSIPSRFELNEFSKSILQKIHTDLFFEAGFVAFNQLYIIEYQTPLNLIGKIGLKKRFILLLLKNGDKLYYKIQSLASVLGKGSTKKRTVFFQDAQIEKLDTLVQNELRAIYWQEKNKFRLDFCNQFLEPSPEIEFLLLQNRHEQEIFLCAQQIEQLKCDTENSKKLIKACFVQSNERQIIINKENTQIIAQSKTQPLKEKAEAGRNRYFWNIHSFLPTKKNKNKLKIIAQIPEDKLQAIRFIIAQNNLAGDRCEILHKQLIQISQNPYDELIFELLQAKENKDKQTTRIVELVKIILNDKLKRSYLEQCIEDWKLDTENQFFILQIFLEYVQEFDSVEDLLIVHRKIRDNFMHKQKNEYEQALFDLAFCRHLIWADELEEAKEQISKRLKNLPDESLWNILPAEDSVEQFSGQYLRINYLKLLKKVSLDQEKQKVLNKLAILRPLNVQIIKENKNFSVKFEQAYEILKGRIQVNQMQYSKIIKVLDPKLSKKIEHPLSSENKLISKLQNWLASAKVQNLKLIKQYSENLKKEKQVAHFEVIDNLSHFFQIKKLECYIAYGKKSSEITAFKDDPPFLLIGQDFLDKDNIRYLQINEFAFITAIELSAIYFDNSLLTSSDIWKGATRKGLFVADTLLSILPAAGAISSGLKNLKKMEKISQWAGKIGNIGQWGQSGILALQSLHPILEKIGKKEDNEVEILFSSRLLQINADRLGLLIANDMAAALNGILKTHDNYEAINKRIVKNGLIEFLNEKNSEGKLKQKDLALRIAALLSFYFSDDFDRLSLFLRQPNEEIPLIFYK